jgi:hypothetical protein
MEKRRLFLGRFELAKGPPLHKSSTSLIIKAIDRGAEDEYREAFENAVKKEESPNKHGNYIGGRDFNNVLDVKGWDKDAFKDQFEKRGLNRDKKISKDEFVELLKSVLDHGRPREVVLKFMRNTEQFRREVDFGDGRKFDSKYVVGVTESFSCEDTDQNFSAALKLFGGNNITTFASTITLL